MKTCVLVATTLLMSVLLSAPGQAERPRLTRAQFTGTYKAGEYGTLEVEALPGGKVRFHFEGFAHLDSPGGPNMGEADGILTLHHNIAVYSDMDDGGRMVLRFAPRRVYISQAGNLGFGMGVIAAGVYTKTSRRTPKFDPKD